MQSAWLGWMDVRARGTAWDEMRQPRGRGQRRHARQPPRCQFTTAVACSLHGRRCRSVLRWTAACLSSGGVHGCACSGDRARDRRSRSDDGVECPFLFRRRRTRLRRRKRRIGRHPIRNLAACGRSYRSTRGHDDHVMAFAPPGTGGCVGGSMRRRCCPRGHALLASAGAAALSTCGRQLDLSSIRTFTPPRPAA